MEQPNRLRRFVIRTAILGSASGIFGYFVGGWIARSDLAPIAVHVPEEDIASTAIALILLLLAGVALFISSSAERYKRMVEKRDDDDPVEPATLKSGRVQSVVVALAALALLIPPFVGGGQPESVRIAAAVATLVLVAAQSWYNWRLWRDGDELTRSVIVSASAACFFGLQLVLFCWAALVKLALAPDITSWTMVTILLAVYLIVSIWFSMRRGLTQI